MTNPGPSGIITTVDAGIAHLVERHLAKVEVASSSLVARSSLQVTQSGGLFFCFWRKHKNALPPPLRCGCAAKKPPLCTGRWPSAARTEGLLPACAHGNNPPVMASPCQPPLHKGAPLVRRSLAKLPQLFWQFKRPPGLPGGLAISYPIFRWKLP